jgi:hypothetical protein
MRIRLALIPSRCEAAKREITMAKGNHVFNNFDGAIQNAYKNVLEIVNKDLLTAFNALHGSGGDGRRRQKPNARNSCGKGS